MCGACLATPTGERFGPAWLHVTLRPPCPATLVSVGVELPGDRKGVTGGSPCRRTRLRLGPGCGTGSRAAGRVGAACSDRAWLSRSVRGAGVRPPARLFSPSGSCLSYLQRCCRWVTGLPSGPAAWPGQPRLARVCFSPGRPPSEHVRGGSPVPCGAPCALHESRAWQTDRTHHAEEPAGSAWTCPCASLTLAIPRLGTVREPVHSLLGQARSFTIPVCWVSHWRRPYRPPAQSTSGRSAPGRSLAREEAPWPPVRA